MQGNLFVFSSNQMVDNVGAGGTTPTVAKPFFANIAKYHRGRIVNTTVPTSMFRQICKSKNTLFIKNRFL